MRSLRRRTEALESRHTALKRTEELTCSEACCHSGLTRRPLVLLGLFVFVAAGLFAFSKLNIEAYPNPAPVILEITAQAPGLSAEEMERYYTIPIEVGLAATPGVDVIRSTSFYGLSFVRVTFNYGVDYYFALTQTAINLQQNVSLPNNVTPQIQATSLVGEIYRYQVVGPPHFGLTNLRTVQDWIVQRRLLTVPGVVQVNTWGGTTKEYDVEVDLHKLDAYNVTLPQVITRARQRQRQCRRPHHQFRPAVREYSRRRPDGHRRRRRFDARLQGRGHRERRAVADATACRFTSRTSPRSRSATCRGSARPAATTRTTSSPRSSS